jgi:hypothetical protein
LQKHLACHAIGDHAVPADAAAALIRGPGADANTCYDPAIPGLSLILLPFFWLERKDCFRAEIQNTCERPRRPFGSNDFHGWAGAANCLQDSAFGALPAKRGPAQRGKGSNSAKTAATRINIANSVHRVSGVSGGTTNHFWHGLAVPGARAAPLR